MLGKLSERRLKLPMPASLLLSLLLHSCQEHLTTEQLTKMTSTGHCFKQAGVALMLP